MYKMVVIPKHGSFYRIAPKSKVLKKKSIFPKKKKKVCKYPRYTFIVTVQLILILYFQKVLEYLGLSPNLSLPKHSNNNLIRRVIFTYYDFAYI